MADSVVLNGSAATRDAAIDEAGQLLLARGAVDNDYILAMHEREESVSTYMGSFLAIPHGTNAAKDHIKKSVVSVVRYPDGIDWNGKEVKFVVGVAASTTNTSTSSPRSRRSSRTRRRWRSLRPQHPSRKFWSCSERSTHSEGCTFWRRKHRPRIRRAAAARRRV